MNTAVHVSLWHRIAKHVTAIVAHMYIHTRTYEFLWLTYTYILRSCWHSIGLCSAPKLKSKQFFMRVTRFCVRFDVTSLMKFVRCIKELFCIYHKQKCLHIFKHKYVVKTTIVFQLNLNVQQNTIKSPFKFSSKIQEETISRTRDVKVLLCTKGCKNV